MVYFSCNSVHDYGRGRISVLHLYWYFIIWIKPSRDPQFGKDSFKVVNSGFNMYLILRKCRKRMHLKY